MSKIYVLVGSNRDYSYGDEWVIRAYSDKAIAESEFKKREDAKKQYQIELSAIYDHSRNRYKTELPNVQWNKLTPEQQKLNGEIKLETENKANIIWDKYLKQFEIDRMPSSETEGSFPDYWFLTEVDLV